MTDRAVYVLPLRIVLLVLAVVFVVGGVGGATAAWIFVRRALPEGTGGARIVERVERVSGTTSSFADVAEKVRAGVVGLLDEHGTLLQNGVVLTADGLLLSPSRAGAARPPRVLLADGSTVPAAFLREYPEKGVALYRVSGSFPAPRLALDVPLQPGTAGVAVRAVPSTGSTAALPVTVEALVSLAAAKSREQPSVERVGIVRPTLDRAYHGAPAFGADERLLGLVLVDADGSVVLPVSDIDVVLQDILRHPTGETVSVLGGMRGVWLSREELTKRSIKNAERAFLIEAVPTGSPTGEAGLKAQDVITGVDGKGFPAAGHLWGVLLEAARSSKPVTLDVRRGEETIKVGFTPRLGS
jgi:S1-C subfamily serine protease